jgi:hypothetical protein
VPFVPRSSPTAGNGVCLIESSPSAYDSPLGIPDEDGSSWLGALETVYNCRLQLAAVEPFYRTLGGSDLAAFFATPTVGSGVAVPCYGSTAAPSTTVTKYVYVKSIATRESSIDTTKQSNLCCLTYSRRSVISYTAP